MQRLYSNFARGWPGTGLLFLRLTAAVGAIHNGACAFGADHSIPVALSNGAIALLLCAGLWTPIAGSGLAALAIWSGLGRVGDLRSQLLLGAISAALAMLGPGAWSVDARLFGRKRLIHEP